jgi:hypothetical protein
VEQGLVTQKIQTIMRVDSALGTLLERAEPGLTKKGQSCGVHQGGNGLGPTLSRRTWHFRSGEERKNQHTQTCRQG